MSSRPRSSCPSSSCAPDCRLDDAPRDLRLSPARARPSGIDPPRSTRHAAYGVRQRPPVERRTMSASIRAPTGLGASPGPSSLGRCRRSSAIRPTGFSSDRATQPLALYHAPTASATGMLYRVSDWSAVWPAAGFVDTEIGCFREPEASDAEAQVQSRVQDRGGPLGA
jgi:hypothetical protein